MKNLILTGLVFATAISLSFAQLKVVAPVGNVNLGDVSAIAQGNEEKLNVGGNIQATNFVEALGSGMLVGRGSTGTAFLDLYYNQKNTRSGFTGRLLSDRINIGTDAQPVLKNVTSFQHQGNGDFTFRTYIAGSAFSFVQKGVGSSMFINSGGFVGIGTKTPTAKLEVNGVAKKPGGGDWQAASDKRLKDDIKEFNKGLESILKLNPVSYRYNGKGGIKDTETTYVGLIAQEFQKVAPDAVSSYKHKDVTALESEAGGITYKTSEIEEEYLQIDPSQIKYMLVNAVKEQQKLISQLQEEIHNMKASGVTSTPVNQINLLIEGNGSENALLAQNAPNPFTSNTKIGYYVPNSVKSAVISFTDITGKEIKSINIDEVGSGFLDVSIKEMPIGIYSYSLVIDEKTVATKKMVLSR